MPESEKYLLKILKELVGSKVKFIVCGGLAAVLHGVERFTFDLDISLSMKPENVRRFLGAMKKMHMVPRVPVPAEALMDKKKLKEFASQKGALVFTFIDVDSPFKQIDVFITEELSFEKLSAHSCPIDLEKNCRIAVLSAEMLLEMKLRIKPPREKDIQDIRALKSMLERRK